MASLLITDQQQHPLYVTGGNDKSIALWDISDCFNQGTKVLKTSNGLFLAILAGV